MSKPPLRRAACHPRCCTKKFEIHGTIAPPMPILKYAKPIAFPRDFSKHSESKTWLGNGPPQTNPRAFRM